VRPTDQDAGPFRIAHLIAIWRLFARTAEALWEIRAIGNPSAELRKVIDAREAEGVEVVSHADITRVVRLLALQAGMHADDWLRMTAADALLPRRKPPPAVELQIRLRWLNCKRLVCRLDEAKQNYRVTIHNVRGDVASVESCDFANALEGAIKMAGARAEGDEHEADRG
jgi:hypothetical protein